MLNYKLLYKDIRYDILNINRASDCTTYLKENSMKTRSSGILLHISSLPGEYGIGDFGLEAYNFVDFLVKSKQKNWQILPLGVTGFGDSPYQSFSAFAGNPYFIDLDELIDQGYLSKEYVKSVNLGKEQNKVDYGILYINKMMIIRTAYNNAMNSSDTENIKIRLNEFYHNNIEWLREFALYMSLKAKNKNKSWLEWDREYRDINSDAVSTFESENQEDMYFWIFNQYYFFKQWKKLKDYANHNNINIIGDLPIYVAVDSADVWSNPEYYNLDQNYNPITVAGCPPDEFTAGGQLWGNPIYKWDLMEQEGFSWWIKRMKSSFQLFDIVRLDHFIGFETYYEIKYGSKDAVHGIWKKGPGIKLFNKIKEELGDLNIIVEDLGHTTDAVRMLVVDANFPNMKVMHFAFNPNDESEHSPHSLARDSVIYTGTHDNHTTLGWIENVSKDDLEYAIEYLKLNKEEGFNWGIIRGAWASPAYLAIAPMQDFLGLGDEARMNIPSTIGDNWTWRMKKEDIKKELAMKIAQLTKIYWR